MTPHPDIAQRAYELAALPDPPRAAEHALAYVTRLLSMLPQGERAGYLLKPGGDNVAQLPDGAWVSVGRICYPNGDLVKVMGDVPNGGPQWAQEVPVDPNRYYAYTGSFTPVPPPPTVDLGPLLTRLTLLESRASLFMDLATEIAKQIGILNKQLADLDAAVVKKPLPEYEGTGRIFGFGVSITSRPK